MYVCIELVQFVPQQKLSNMVKQLYSNKKLKNKVAIIFIKVTAFCILLYVLF